MSAIPNLPASVKDVNDTNADAALRQQLNTRAATQEHEESKQNGVKTGPAWHLHETPVENQRCIRVIVIGCGYSGIYMGIRIPEKLRNTELVIYEKNAGVR